MPLRRLLLLLFLASTPLLGQITTPAAAPRFEVSTVRRTPLGTDSSRSMFDNGLFVATNVTLKSLIEHSAYEIPQSRILGSPKWLDSERFNIEAKVDAGTASRLKTLTVDQRRSLQQSLSQQLLADRFKLAVHWETRTLPIYVLITTKTGAKLQPSKAADSRVSAEGSAKGYSLTAQGRTLGEFAETLTQVLSGVIGRVVLDKTNIRGRYDITLQWTSADTANAASDSGPSIFTALQEQLGLKLEPAKGPVQVLVIDHVEMPMEN